MSNWKGAILTGLIILIFLTLIANAQIINFNDRFERSDLGNWGIVDGTPVGAWAVVNGELRHNSDSTTGNQWIAQDVNDDNLIDFNNFIINTKVRVSGIDSTNAFRILSFLDDANTQGTYLEWKTDTNKFNLNIGSEHLTTQAYSGIDTNYAIKIVSVDGNYSVYVNGVYDNSFTDFTYFDMNRIGIISNWGLGAAPDVFTYQDDINLISDPDQPLPITDFTVGINYNIDKSNQKIDLNGFTTDNNVDDHATISDWNWLIDGSTTGINAFNDQNTYFSPATPNTDYNACVIAVGTMDVNGETFTHQTCETISSGRFFGLLHLTTIDESTGALLNGVNVNFDSNDYTVNSELWLDLNFLSETTTEKTMTFTLSNYGTRYYTIDINRFSDINLPMLMLPDSNGINIEFQMYEPDAVTLYTDVYIDLLNSNKDWNYAGRRKTDASGKINFFMNPNDAGYTLRIYDSNGETVDYNSMVLTVNKPKDETTAAVIDGNWNLDVGGLAWQSYTNLTGNQTVQIYANTSSQYELTVVDDNADYFERKYYVAFLGATTAETVQPYLVPTASAVSTTIFTISGYTQEAVGDVAIRIYKTIPIAGRVIVEQVVTDDKGEALISLIANDSYEFEVYINEALQGTLEIVATSTSIYISLDDLTIVQPTLDAGAVSVNFSPNRSKLLTSDTNLIQTIKITDINLGITFTNAQIWVTNTDVNGTKGNDVNIYSTTITSLTNNIGIDSSAQTLNGVSYDTNGHLVVYVLVTTNQGTQLFKFVYKPKTDFDWTTAIGFNLRPTFGCSTTTNPLIPCGTMFLIAIFVSLMITIGVAIETGYNAMEGMGAIFLMIMGIFTYLTWVPYILFGIILVATVGLMFTLGGKKY